MLPENLLDDLSAYVIFINISIFIPYLCDVSYVNYPFLCNIFGRVRVVAGLVPKIIWNGMMM